MTPTSISTCSIARSQLLAQAREDIQEGMAHAIPFVLAHPREAGVLSELGLIASESERGVDVFRFVVGELVATVVRAEGRDHSRIVRTDY